MYCETVRDLKIVALLGPVTWTLEWAAPAIPHGEERGDKTW
jgi:hypothetical protein